MQQTELFGILIIIKLMSYEYGDDELYLYADLQQLKERIRLSSNKLQELTRNQNKYVKKLIGLNFRAKQLINQELYQQALVYLSEAERILEYGASCGKTIDRNMIITILHNEACCFYKETELMTAAKYIEGVIFNLKSHLASIEPSPSNSYNALGHSQRKKTDEFINVTIQKKIQLVQYQMKFCTINSQARSRDVALNAGLTVIKVLENLFKDIKHENPKISACDQNSPDEEIKDLNNLLKNIKFFHEQISTTELLQYINLARFYVNRWNQQKITKKINFLLERHVNNYSISEVIDMIPIEYKADEQMYSQLINTRTIMRQLLHFSMGYFTISTEYRLISEHLYINLQDRLKSQEYIKANIFHLLSILFQAINLNCDLLFMKQVVSSYEHHFKIDLQICTELKNVQIQKLTQKLLISHQKQRLTAKKTSLMDKIHKMKSKSKDKNLKTEYNDSYAFSSQVCYKTTSSKQLKGKFKVNRSVSKNSVKEKVSKKMAKVLNDSLFEGDNMTINKDRSLSMTKQTVVKKRSVSKKSIESPKLTTFKLPVKKQKLSKRTNDEYLLSKAKLNDRKRLKSSNSISSSVSHSIKSKEASKIKAFQSEKIIDKRQKSKKSQAVSKKKKQSKDKKPIINKHYYV